MYFMAANYCLNEYILCGSSLPIQELFFQVLVEIQQRPQSRHTDHPKKR